MKKTIKTIISLCLCFCLFTSLILPAHGADKELHITTADELIEFAENCRLDKYSQNLTVYLDNDIDLTDKDFKGIPILCGTFEGNGHTITGVNITVDGSVQGLFRYISETGCVQNLTVYGSIFPEGSCKTVGGIAGSNAGTIKNCNFTGQVSGRDTIGGFVGVNTVKGVIENCLVDGSISGIHFVGGITGENYGTVRECKNFSQINSTEKQNNVNISDISLETITGTESARTVTDIGGIAGTSGGVIRSCENYSTIGYQHMGYNIGGIAGSQKGYIVDCKNSGTIYGRKEVGGIVGQMEPISKIEYSIDTLQILKNQINNTSAIASQMSTNAQNSVSDINGQVNIIKEQSGVAHDALSQLLPNSGNEFPPDSDQILAAQNALSSSINAMQGAVEGISSSSSNAVNTFSNDIKAFTNQMNAINQTLSNASSNVGVSVTDISDKDKPNDLTGKIESSKNNGLVLGDLNVGGIVGAIAFENDLDPEDDFQINGNKSMNVSSELRAVILDCKNTATISAKKKQAGGIAGWSAMGLIKGCVNTGSIEAESGDYIGGIVGNSTGFIRENNSKCKLIGLSYVGGIAGSATIVTDCRSAVTISSGKENLGTVMGAERIDNSEIKNPYLNNYYMITNSDIGGIDGISYADIAEPLSTGDFLSLNNINDIFKESTVTFIGENGTENNIIIKPGESLNKEDIPDVPVKNGYSGEWENLSDTDTSNIYFDLIFRPKYTAYYTTIQSEKLRDNNTPILLAQGHFHDKDNFEIEICEETPILSENEAVIECWKTPELSQESDTQLRFSYPKDNNIKSAKVMVKDSNGDWCEREFTVKGSYIVFTTNPSDQAFCVIDSPNSYTPIFVICGVAAISLLTFAIIHHKKSRKKN